MIKTFLQRWWILNKLHRFALLEGGVVWVDENRFISYMRDLITDKSNQPTPTYPISGFHSWLWEIRDDLLLHSKLKNTIDECSDPNEGISYIVSQHTIKNNPLSGHSLRLSTLGRERYSWSYIFFGTDYAKKIWTGLMVGLLILFATSSLRGIFPDKPIEVKVQYPTPTEQNTILNSNGKG